MQPVMMYGDVINTLADLQKRKAALDRDTLLSEAGKQQSAQQIAAQRNAYAGKALTTFKGDWQELRRVYGELKADREQIAEKAAKSWDFARLNYERESAIGRIKAARTPEEVSAGYEAVKLGGDRHAMRAFAETAASMLGGVKTFTDTGAMHDVKAAMQSEAAKITTPPDMPAQREAESSLSGDIAKLYKATQQAANEFYPPLAYSIESNPFLRLLDGVRVDSKVNHLLETETSVTVDWD